MRFEAGGSRLHRVAGLAGLGYVVGVGIENMEVLDAPSFDSSVAEIRAAYDDQALSIVTTIAGIAALVSYVVFAVAVYRVLRANGDSAGRWPLVALVGGVGGPLVATIGAVANVVLALDAGGLSDDALRNAFEWTFRAEDIAGILVAAFMLGVGISALRTGLLPRWLGWFAGAIALAVCLAPVAGLTEDRGLQEVVIGAFALQTLWIFLAGMYLTFEEARPRAEFVRQAAFFLLVVAAGLVGIALLAVPDATGQFFAWSLAPVPLAAFAGGVYVGSATVYAFGLREPPGRSRGLVLAAVVLSVSVLIITLTHADQFEFGRLQAVAWLVLFAGFSLVTVWLLALVGERQNGGPGPPLPSPARWLLLAIAVALGVLALALWIDPTGLSDASPFDLPPLGGRFAGSWVALLATLAGWAALRGDRADARIAALALIALAAGALVAALRTIGDLDPAAAAVAYTVALALVIGVGATVLAASARQPSPKPPP